MTFRVLKLAVFDFEEIISENRLRFSNSLENDLRTNLALIKNVNIEVVAKQNDEISLSAVEKAKSINVPFVITGGYEVEKIGLKISAKLIDVKSGF